MSVYMFSGHFAWAPLHAAAYYGSTKMIDELISAGGDIEVEDTWYSGRPLAWAAFGAHPKICKVLIQEYGAKIDAKNIHGQIAADLVPDLSIPSWKGAFSVSLKHSRLSITI
jgi:ankyrin repeat protein